MNNSTRKNYRFSKEILEFINNRDVSRYQTESEFIEASIRYLQEQKHRQFIELRFLELEQRLKDSEQKIKQLEEKINYENPNQDFSAINTFN